MVPAHNEAVLLPRLLGTLQAAAAASDGGADGVELIVADNASTDATAEIAGRYGCRVAPVAKRAIAAARNGGAALARGAILCFIDADMQVHPQTFNAIEATLRAGGAIGGASGVRPERWSPGIAVTWAMLVPGVRLLGIDTGVVFCRREDFVAVGGYPEDRLAAEDVAFLFALKRRGRSRGERFVRLRSVKAIMSTRKFDQHGDWHYFRSMALMLWLTLTRRRQRFDREARSYWYEGR